MYDFGLVKIFVFYKKEKIHSFSNASYVKLSLVFVPILRFFYTAVNV